MRPARGAAPIAATRRAGQNQGMDGFARHITACNNMGSPAGRIPFRILGHPVGLLPPDLARWLAYRPQHFHFDAKGVSLATSLRGIMRRDAALADAVKGMAREGYIKHRDEPFDVRASADGPVLARLDRGAIPAFGIISQGVHLNGLVRRADGLHLWLGRRSPTKAVAPGQWDNIVAGGTPAGLDALGTLTKEAGEEAGLPPTLVADARPVARLSYNMLEENGRLRRDILHVFDLDIPEDFTPSPQDDEVEFFELWPAQRVLELVRDTDSVKFNVNLVLIDLFLREGMIDPASAQGLALRAGLDQGGGF
jgi:8-oxo-dGTP pyrophosphatase MutT (NUDIX family)